MKHVTIKSSDNLPQEKTNKTSKLLDFLKIPYTKLNDLTEIRTTEIGLLIVANLDSTEEAPYN